MKSLAEHFNCDVNAYEYTKFESSEGIVKELIREQIDKKHPLGFYYKAKKDDENALVIDAYSEENDEFFVYLNPRADGGGNHWYKIIGLGNQMESWSLIAIE